MGELNKSMKKLYLSLIVFFVIIWLILMGLTYQGVVDTRTLIIAMTGVRILGTMAIALFVFKEKDSLLKKSIELEKRYPRLIKYAKSVLIIFLVIVLFSGFIKFLDFIF
jgi:amino acid transporter